MSSFLLLYIRTLCFLSIKRERSSIQITEDLKDMFVYAPVDQWGDIENAMDMAKIQVGFYGTIVTVGSIVLEDDTLKTIAEAVLESMDL